MSFILMSCIVYPCTSADNVRSCIFTPFSFVVLSCILYPAIFFDHHWLFLHFNQLAVCTLHAVSGDSELLHHLIICIHSETGMFFFPWPFTLTYELNLSSIKVNQHSKCLGKRPSSWKVTVCMNRHRHTHTQPTALPGPLKTWRTWQL